MEGTDVTNAALIELTGVLEELKPIIGGLNNYSRIGVRDDALTQDEADRVRARTFKQEALRDVVIDAIAALEKVHASSYPRLPPEPAPDSMLASLRREDLEMRAARADFVEQAPATTGVAEFEGEDDD